MTLTTTRASAPAMWPAVFVGAVVATVAVALGVTASGGSALYSKINRGFPGLATAYTSTALEVVAQLAAVLCLGAAFYAAFIRVRRGHDRMLLSDGVELTVVRVSAAVWGLTSVALIAVDAADSNGQPLSKLLQSGALGYLFTASYAPGAWLAAAICAFVVFLVSVFARNWQATVFMVFASAIGLLAPVLVGAVLVGPNHDFGGDATAFGMPAFAALAGMTAVLIGRLLGGGRIGPIGARRYLLAAGGTWAVMVAAQVIIAMFELDGTGLFASTTGLLFSAWFLLALVSGALILTQWRHRPVVSGRVSGGFVAAGAVNIVAFALMIGVNEGLERVPPPQFFAPTTTMQLFFGYDVDHALTWVTAFTDWRINILFAAPTVAAMILYGWAVRRLRRRGDSWSAGRTSAWMLGCVVVILTTSSALGPYASAMFSAHMLFHMSLNMLAPLLLVMGGPVTLALRATRANGPSKVAGPHEWINAMLHWSVTRKLYNPLIVFVEFIGSYYLIYLTDIFGWGMRYHWAHQLMNLHFLIVGYLFYSLVAGVDRPPRPLPHIGKLGMVLAAMPFHAFFGVIVMTMSSVIANVYYAYIAVPFMHDLHQDQVIAGGIAWAAGEPPLLVVVIALVTQWSRQDNKDAKQIDRHIDRGLDDSFEAYNEMLTKLAGRDPDAALPAGEARPDADPDVEPEPAVEQPVGARYRTSAPEGDERS